MAKTPSRMELDALSPTAWVAEERRRQVAARGEQNHSVYKWWLILSEEIGEVAKVIEHRQEGKIGHDEYLRELEYELIQSCAVGIGFLEAIRRGRGTEADPLCPCDRCVPVIKEAEALPS